MELIEKLKHNIIYHIRPYNLGDNGETETLIMELIRQLEAAQQMRAIGQRGESAEIDENPRQDYKRYKNGVRQPRRR